MYLAKSYIRQNMYNFCKDLPVDDTDILQVINRLLEPLPEKIHLTDIPAIIIRLNKLHSK